jgi:predicted peptidase
MSVPNNNGQRAASFEATIERVVGCEYLLYLPEAYDEHDSWPLILFLHGAGERGHDLERIKKHGPPRLIARGQQLPFIIVSPQCPDDRWWDIEMLGKLLDRIEGDYAVDFERIYITGLSMGGFATWSLAHLYPHRFAAIAPVCGGSETYGLAKIRHLPVWAFHGARDEIVPLRRSQEMADALTSLGGNVKLTIYPNAKHDSWTETYDNPKLYEWFLEHRRQS